MIQQILPIFLVITFGFILKAVHIASESWISVLNRFGLYVGFPILIFVNMIELDRAHLAEQLPVVGITIGIICSFMIITYLVIRAFRITPTLGTLFIVAVFNGNTGYLGFPLISALIPGSEPTIGLIVASYTISLFTVGIYLMDSLSGGKRSITEQLVQIISSPFLISILCSVIVIYTGITVPGPLMDAFHMIEGAAGPVVLISLGIFMCRRISIRSIILPFIILFSVKMILFPAAFLAFGKLFTLPQAYRIATLEAMMPSAVNIFALSDRYEMNRELAAAMIVISTILSPFMFPLFASLIS